MYARRVTGGGGRDVGARKQVCAARGDHTRGTDIIPTVFFLRRPRDPADCPRFFFNKFFPVCVFFVFEIRIPAQNRFAGTPKKLRAAVFHPAKIAVLSPCRFAIYNGLFEIFFSLLSFCVSAAAPGLKSKITTRHRATHDSVFGFCVYVFLFPHTRTHSHTYTMHCSICCAVAVFETAELNCHRC